MRCGICSVRRDRAGPSTAHAFDDLTSGNVVLPGQSLQPCIVDVEDMKEGFFGFDCLWMLVVLTRTSCPVDTIMRGHKDVRSRRKVIWGLRDLALSGIRSATTTSLPAMAGLQ